VTFLAFATWIVVAIATAWVAGALMKAGGYGVKADITLGLAGSGVACVTAWSLDMFPGPAIGATAIIAFVAAAAAITLQRRFFTAPPGNAPGGAGSSTWRS
jgi:uncharacterized membrane protein YeaQ/YmgE (transglycosylase-associated protein family)